jgi:hypothetical protein
MAAADPAEFAIASSESQSTKRPRGMTALPKDFGWQLLPGIDDFLQQLGLVAPNQREWLLERFKDYCASRSERSADWPASFRLWAETTVSRFGSTIPAPMIGDDLFDSRPTSTAIRGGAFGRFGGGAGRGTRGEDATRHNLAGFHQVNRERQGG